MNKNNQINAWKWKNCMIKKHMWCWFVRITKCFACFQWKNIFCDLSECILLQTFHVLIVNKSNMTIGWICSNFFAWFHQHLFWIVDAIFSNHFGCFELSTFSEFQMFELHDLDALSFWLFKYFVFLSCSFVFACLSCYMFCLVLLHP